MSCELCNKIWNGGLKEYKENQGQIKMKGVARHEIK